MGSVFGKIGQEMPKYTSIKHLSDNVEIRNYEKAVAIETDIDEQNKGSSFMRLASYIGVIWSAENDRKETISMTSPVVKIESADKAR